MNEPEASEAERRITAADFNVSISELVMAPVVQETFDSF